MTTRKIAPLGGAAETSAQGAAMSRTIDLRGFIALLERATTDGRMDEVRAMMRLERFLIWHEVTGDHATGVLQGAGGPPSRHACRIDRDGRYMCCGQDLEPCAGLQGKLCEHLATLMLALVQFGLADATMISEWARRALGEKVDLDRDAMAAALARCDGA